MRKQLQSEEEFIRLIIPYGKTSQKLQSLGKVGEIVRCLSASYVRLLPDEKKILFRVTTITESSMFILRK